MWRWLIFGLLALAVVTGLLVIGPTTPRPQTARPLPPAAAGPGQDQAVAGGSMPPAQAASVEDPAAAGEEPVLRQYGGASYYADKYQGRRTASGERYDQDELTAASPTLPLGAHATVVADATGRSVDVTITDRGPGIAGRVVDLSRKAAERLGITEEGVAPVHVEARPSQQPTPELAQKIAQDAQAQAAKAAH